jgi:putative transposase
LRTTFRPSPGIGTALIDPGKPWQNGAAKGFNGKFRDEWVLS